MRTCFIRVFFLQQEFFQFLDARYIYIISTLYFWFRPGKAAQRAKLDWLDVVRLLRLRKTYVQLYMARARHQVSTALQCLSCIL